MAADSAFDNVDLAGQGYKAYAPTSYSTGHKVNTTDFESKSTFNPDYSWISNQQNQKEEVEAENYDALMNDVSSFIG